MITNKRNPLRDRLKDDDDFINHLLFDDDDDTDDKIGIAKEFKKIWTTPNELVIAPGNTFSMEFEKEHITVNIPTLVRATHRRYPAGAKLWVAFERDHSMRCELSAIMELDLHRTLQEADRTVKGDGFTKAFWECPERMRNEIMIRRHTIAKQDKDIRHTEIAREFFALAYAVSKKAYTMEQQDRINNLLPRNGSVLFRGKSEQQLDYILNTWEEFRNRIVPDREQITNMFRDGIYKRETQKQRIVDLLVNREQSKDRGLKILLVGGVGTGKKRFLNLIREALGLPYEEIEMSGQSNPSELLGYHSTYSDADAGMILRKLRHCRTAEAMIAWKNVDCTGESREGVSINALRSIFTDDCLTDTFTMYPLSTRNTVHVLTATSTNGLPDFILSNCEIIHLDPYTEDDRVEIARRFLVPELAKKLHMNQKNGKWTPSEATLRFIARNYCSDDGTSKMNSSLENVMRAVQQRILDGQKSVFGRKVIREILGEPDLNDPIIRMNLAKGRYADGILREIEQVREQLRDKTIRERERAICIKELNYLVDLYTPEPYEKPFDKADFLKKLNATHYGLDAVKQTFADHLYAQTRRGGSLKGTRILLAGEPGVGKSTFVASVADAIDAAYARIPLNNISQTDTLKGSYRTSPDADVGMVIMKIAEAMRAKPHAHAILVHLDEVDKLMPYLMNILIDLLDDSALFLDQFIGTPVDLSHVLFVGTANVLKRIPPVILDRFRVIRMNGYTPRERAYILQKYLLPERERAYAASGFRFGMSIEAQELLLRYYSTESGVRELKKAVERMTEYAVSHDNEQRVMHMLDVDTLKAVLGEEPDRSDPMVRFQLAQGRYPENILREIERTRERLRDETIRNDDREIDELRLRYLVDMCVPKPDDKPFDRECLLKRLHETHYGLNDVKELLADHLCAQAHRGENRKGMHILLEGDAGIGKSSITQSFAKAIDAAYVRIALNGIDQASTLKGLYRTYKNADAGMVVKEIAEAMRKHPDAHSIVLHLDEVDKLMPQYANILIDLLDDSALFLDQFIGTPIDLGHVVFVGTANDISQISPIVLDRFRVIHISGYTEKEKAHILQEYLLPEREHLYAASNVRFRMSAKAQTLLLNTYCRGNGIRDLKKAVERLTEYAVSRQKPKDGVLTLDEETIKQVFGEAMPERGNLPAHWMPGCVKALSVSSGGVGNCFAVEALALSGDSGLTITGLAGESIRESVQIAQTYLRSHYACAKGPRFVHISFGEGAVRKDGPSAGVAITVALLSAMRGECSDPKSAYTGEIDLLGNVFPVGGVYQKLRAAQSAGCERAFVPAENVRRMTVSERESLSIRIVPVTHVSEVISTVFSRSDAAREQSVVNTRAM